MRLWLLLMSSQLREQPGRLLAIVLAIAMGVALASSVYLVNSTALGEFSGAAKRLVGEADVVVRGPHGGMPDALFVRLATDSRIRLASPVLEVEAAIPRQRETLKILGIDPFRAEALQFALVGELGEHVLELLAGDGIFLSSAAAERLHLKRGDLLSVAVGDKTKTLKVLGLLSPESYPQSLGVMDIAAAQWVFDSVGRLNRIDLRLPPGADAEALRRALGNELPPGVIAIAPQIEKDRAASATRAYRVNLNMLALVALWTGAFLVFATQSLSALRRRSAFALLRALGVTRAGLQYALIGEGAALGAVGAALGLISGVALAALMLRLLSGDLGNGQLHAAAASLRAQPGAILAFFLIGTAVSAFGAWLPARAAAREPPARALKGGGGDYRHATRAASLAGLALLGAGAALAWLPAVRGLPVFGYAAVAALLFGAMLLLPALTVRILAVVPPSGRVVVDTAIAQLKDNVGLSTLSLGSVIVSFSLMVAMAIMVYSFRVSFEHWLGRLLPADIEVRVPLGSDTAFLSADDQARLAAVPGIDRIRFRRTRQLLLDASHPQVTLIARDFGSAGAGEQLPLLRQAPGAPQPGRAPAWISEALQDLYGLGLGAPLDLPLDGHTLHLEVMGVWRDYARSGGSVVIDRALYREATGDRSATEASLWFDRGLSSNAAESAIRSALPADDAFEIYTSSAIHERSLQIFDRAFAITYALEAIAVLIGLTGISFAAGSTALARRAEFGMLRHVGMLRRQIVGLLGVEGLLLGLFGVIYGLALGGILSLVLVYVVNRQSFNWSIDLAVPVWQLGAISLLLMGAAALTATWSGRAALSQDAVRAVREDW